VKTELADFIEKFIEVNPQYGYRSIAQFVEDSSRKRLEELKALRKMKPEKLVEKRVEKFSKMGAWKE